MFRSDRLSYDLTLPGWQTLLLHQLEYSEGTYDNVECTTLCVWRQDYANYVVSVRNGTGNKLIKKHSIIFILLLNFQTEYKKM